MANKIVHINTIGEVTFSRNKRSKSIKISIRSNCSVLVSYPYYASQKDVIRFLNKNEKWIIEQQNKFKSKKTAIKPNSEIQTKLFCVKFVKGEKNQLEQTLDTIIITIKDFDSEDADYFIRNCLTAVYRYEAKCILPERLDRLAKQHGFSYNKVSVRANSSKWGSCSSQNNISLTLQMMKLPYPLIDYIILHELVHTEVKNHGADFWHRLNEITNQQAKKLAKEVKKHTTDVLGN